MIFFFLDPVPNYFWNDNCHIIPNSLTLTLRKKKLYQLIELRYTDYSTWVDNGVSVKNGYTVLKTSQQLSSAWQCLSTTKFFTRTRPR